MEQDQVYFRTKSGEQALAEPMRLLQHNLRRALALVDGRSTIAQIYARFGDEVVASTALADLFRSGLIATGNDARAQESTRSAPAPRAAPATLPPAPPPSSPVSIIEEISLSAGDEFDDDDFPLDGGVASVPGGQFGVPLQAPPGRPLKPIPRRRWRMSVHWPLLVVIAILGLAASFTALVVLFPYGSYKPQVEKRLTEMLHTPVKIGTMRVTLTPRPNLTLEQVQIGGQGDLRVASAKLIPGMSTLFRRRGLSFAVQLDGVEMDAKGAELLAHARGEPGNTTWHVEYATYSNLTLLIGNNIRLTHLLGDLTSGAGGLEAVNISSEDRNFRVALIGEGAGFRLTATALDWKLGTQLFRSLDLAGVVNGSGLEFSQVDGGVLRGLLAGNLKLGWDGSLRTDLSLSRVDASQLWILLGVDVPARGELSGRIHVESNAGDWSLFASKARIEGDVRLSRGQVDRMDVGSAIRNGTGNAVRGGMTGFDEFASGFQRDGTTWRFSNLRLSAGSMGASGDIAVEENGPLTGVLQVSLSGKIHSPVTFGGTLKDPVLRGVRGG